MWAEGWSVQNKYTNVQRKKHVGMIVLRLGQLTLIQTQGEASQMAPSPKSLQRSLEWAQRPTTELAKHTEEIAAAWERKSAVEKGRAGQEGYYEVRTCSLYTEEMSRVSTTYHLCLAD